MGSSFSTPKDDAESRARIEQLIHENPVLAFTKITCPYCASTKLLLKTKHVQYRSIDVDRVSGGSKLHATLKRMTGHQTVPCIFINGKLIGGNSELHSLKRSGELDKMLASIPQN